MKAMAPAPADRYQSVPELRAEVLRWLRGGIDLPRLTFKAGDLVTRENEPGDAAYIIEAGRCRVFRTVDGEKVVLREMGPGDVFGETAILAAQPRTATVEALGDLTVMAVTADTLARGIGLNSWLAPFVRALADRFREVDARLAMLEAGLNRQSSGESPASE